MDNYQYLSFSLNFLKFKQGSIWVSVSGGNVSVLSSAFNYNKFLLTSQLFTSDILFTDKCLMH